MDTLEQDLVDIYPGEQWVLPYPEGREATFEDVVWLVGTKPTLKDFEDKKKVKPIKLTLTQRIELLEQEIINIKLKLPK